MSLQPAQWLFLAMLALCAVLLAVLIALVCALNRRTRRIPRRFSEEMNRLEDGLDDQNARQREELARNLYQMNESLVNTFGSVSQTHGDQVSALIRQSHENAQAADLRQQGMQRMLEESLRRMEGRIEALRQSTEEGMRLMREQNDEKLSEMRRTVDEKLNDTLEKRLSASFSQVSERLEQVYRSLGEMHSLASGVGDLKRMLGNVKTRGVWGEVQLGALLAQALTDTQYQRNVAVTPGSSERVEFAVCLPGHEGGVIYLPIDSKFPQEDYIRLTEASSQGDASAVEAAQKALMNAVRTEAKRIGKYIVPPHTTDFAVMFLPLESLYAEVMRHSQTVESIQREQRVLISGPSTLLALLNSLQMGFRTLAIEQRSAEVWKLLGAVKGDFGSFAALLQKTQEKLQQATDSIDTAFVKTRTIEKRLRHVESLEESEAQRWLADANDQ